MKFVEFLWRPPVAARRRVLPGGPVVVGWAAVVKSAINKGLRELDVKQRCGISQSTLDGWLDGSMEPHELSKPAISNKLSMMVKEIAAQHRI